MPDWSKVRTNTSFRMNDNQLLQMLDSDARGALSLAPVQLRPREVIYHPGTPALHVYFPLTAVVSLVSNMESGASAEVALVGCEGMVGLNAVLPRSARSEQ